MVFLTLTHAVLDKELAIVPELILTIYEDDAGVKVVSNAGTYLPVKEDLETVKNKYITWKESK